MGKNKNDAKEKKFACNFAPIKCFSDISFKNFKESTSYFALTALYFKYLNGEKIIKNAVKKDDKIMNMKTGTSDFIMKAIDSIFYKLTIDYETSEKTFVFLDYPRLSVPWKEINIDFLQESFFFDILDGEKRLKDITLYSILEKLNSNFQTYSDFSKLFVN